MGNESEIPTTGVYSLPGFFEPVSSLSHLLAVPLFLVLGFFLVRRGRGNWFRVLSLSVMTFTTVFLLSMSGVFHLLAPGIGRDVMRHLDVAAVFALIAGTVTPVHAILFKGFQRWAPLALVWSTAAAGITLMSVFSNRIGPGVATAIFVILGWGGLISCILLWRRYGFSFVKPLFGGGVAYTVGAVVLIFDTPTLIPRVITAHELRHAAVLAGLGLHWSFVLRFASGPPTTVISRQTRG